MSRPRKGDEFTHHSFLDQKWKPDRTQTWSQAPKARMTVVSVQSETVYYTYADGTIPPRGKFKMDQAEFLAEYGDELRPALKVIQGGRELDNGGGDVAHLMTTLADQVARIRAERHRT